jgi:hypothetical protein
MGVTQFAWCFTVSIIGAGLVPDAAHAQATSPATKPAAIATATTVPATAPAFPAALPGRGLAQHDFFYAGESRAQNMYIVRGGKVVWSYLGPVNKGEISDAVLMSDGKIVFAHQHGVTLMDSEQKVLWNFDAPTGTEIHTAQPIGKERVVYVQNGAEPKAVVVNVVGGKIEREFPLPVKNLKGVHGQFRRARLTDAGTLLVTHMDMGKVAEYDANGKEVWSLAIPGCWSADRLKNGNTLVCGTKLLREVNANGDTVWDFTPRDLPEYKVVGFQAAVRLPNGNTLFNNWVNEWSGKVDRAKAPVQAWEVTPEKSIVWALRAWDGPDLGPSTVIQLLDDPALVPEDVHFGDIR